MTSDHARAPRPWLITFGLALGALLGWVAIRWLPGRQRQSKVAFIREQAEALTERLGEFAEATGERAASTVSDLKQRAS